MTDLMSPQWWLGTLEAKLVNRQAHMQKMADYYAGDHPLPFVTKAHLPKIRNEFREMMADSKANFTGLVVDAVEERLRVEGIRLSASSDEQADSASWLTWQANQMDSESQVAFTEALVKGVAYLSVWLPPAGSEFASIAVEDPLQTIVGYEPGSNFRRRAAALKVWKDDWTGRDRANVYLPDGIYKFEAAGSEVGGATVSGDERSFEDKARSVVKRAFGVGGSGSRWRMLDGEFVANPLGVVPVVPLRNRPRLLCEGESELVDVWPIQNQINGFLFLLALAGYFGAHRQRWMTGVSLYDEENKPLEPFDAAIDRLWADENPNAKFGDFEQTDLSGYIKALEQKKQDLAVISQTPKHYLLPEGQEPSGDAIKSAEAGLVKKAQRKQRPFGEGIEEAMRLGRRFQGEPDAPADSEVVWADPQIRSEAEVVDAAIKKFTARLSTWEQTCRDIGYSPQTIARMLVAFGGVAPTPNQSAAPETAAA